MLLKKIAFLPCFGYFEVFLIKEAVPEEKDLENIHFNPSYVTVLEISKPVLEHTSSIIAYPLVGLALCCVVLCCVMFCFVLFCW